MGCHIFFVVMIFSLKHLVYKINLFIFAIEEMRVNLRFFIQSIVYIINQLNY